MSIIAWIILGAITGFIAERVTDKKTGLVLATGLGIAGALVGGFLANWLFGVDGLDGFFHLGTWITAIIGAVGLLYLFGAVRGRSRSTRV